MSSAKSSFEKVGECLYRNTSSGTYFALVKVSGKQIKRSLKTTSLPVARRLLRDFRDQQSHTNPQLHSVTVRALCARYEGTIRHQAKATQTRKKAILVRIIAHWQETRAADVQKSDILTWLGSFNFGWASYNLHLEAVRALFELAVADGVLAKSPVDGIRGKRRPQPIRATPSWEEFQEIVRAIRNEPLSDTAQESADVVEFYGLAGLGKIETESLTWADVDLQRGQITAFRRKTSRGFVVPIFPQLQPLIERRRALVLKERGGNRPPQDAKVFLVADPKKALHAACQKLNLPSYSSRAFRRMFITRAIERGVDVKVIAQWQGHRDGGKLILDTYSHVRGAHSAQMAALMA